MSKSTQSDKTHLNYHEPHSRFARLWLAWSHVGGITRTCGRPPFRRIGESGPIPVRRPAAAEAPTATQPCSAANTVLVVQDRSTARCRQTNLARITIRSLSSAEQPFICRTIDYVHQTGPRKRGIKRSLGQFRTRSTFIRRAVENCSKLIFVEHRMKVSAYYCWDSLLSYSLLAYGAHYLI